MKLIFLKCNFNECKRRDVKGMYKKAGAGEIKGFTGLDAPFEEPADADLIIDTDELSVEESVQKVLDWAESFI